jgi:hypothetical protein
MLGLVEQALNVLTHTRFMGSRKSSSLCNCLVKPSPLLYGGCWRKNEVVQDDGRADRSLWNQDFIMIVDERFQPQRGLAKGSHT